MTYTFTMPSSYATVTATFVNPYSTGLVGDIVLSDGKYITATNYEKYSEQLTQTAVAVIFDVSGSNKKGVGLVRGSSLAWAKDSTTGYTNEITDLSATKTGGSNASAAEFIGDGARDGSGSLAKFRTAVGVSSGALSSADYPAWAWIEGYAATANLTETSYESGWYMPSIKELCDLYKAKDAVNNSIEKTGGTQMSTGYYWSSSQNASYTLSAWGVNFESGYINDYYNKTSTGSSVCAVRAFND